MPPESAIHIWYGQKQWPACTMDETVTVANFGTVDGHWTLEGTDAEKLRVTCPVCLGVIKRIEDDISERAAKQKASDESFKALQAELARIKGSRRKEHFVDADNFLSESAAAGIVEGEKLTVLKLGNKLSITHGKLDWCETKEELQSWIVFQQKRRDSGEFQVGFTFRAKGDPTPRTMLGDSIEVIERMFQTRKAILKFIEDWDAFLVGKDP